MSSPCPDRSPLLHGLVDDELDAAHALELEAHLAGCPSCAAERERLRALKATLADPALHYAAPDALRRRVVAALDAEARGRRHVRRPGWRLSRLAPWLAGGGAAALAASLALVLSLPAAPPLDRELVDDHVRSLLAQHLTDVVSEDRHTVKPWFAGRIDYSPPVVDLKDQGFPLAGGRLDYVDGKVTAALVYRRRLHVINLFVRPAKAGYGAGLSSHDGYHVLSWRQGALEFWAVSDLDPTGLEQFRDLFRARAGG
jgi:anti-sigma factor RsiW